MDEAINFLIKQAKRLYYEKNKAYLEIIKIIKEIEDLLLQIKWGEEWERHKTPRNPDDSTNDHPGNPKPTH